MITTKYEVENISAFLGANQNMLTFPYSEERKVKIILTPNDLSKLEPHSLARETLDGLVNKASLILAEGDEITINCSPERGFICCCSSRIEVKRAKKTCMQGTYKIRRGTPLDDLRIELRDLLNGPNFEMTANPLITDSETKSHAETEHKETTPSPETTLSPFKRAFNKTEASITRLESRSIAVKKNHNEYSETFSIHSANQPPNSKSEQESAITLSTPTILEPESTTQSSTPSPTPTLAPEDESIDPPSTLKLPAASPPAAQPRTRRF